MSMMTDLNETTQSLLIEPTNSFPLWSVALISLSVLVVTSMAFVMTVLLCRLLKQRTAKRHNYSIRPQQGSIRLQGSVSHIKNQGSLEVTNAHYHCQATTAIAPDDSSEFSADLGQAAENQQQLSHAVPYEGGSAGEPELRRKRSNEESLLQEREGETREGAHVYDTPYENSRARSQQLRSSSDQQTSREYTHHSHSINDTLQNTQPESVPTVTQESQQQRREAGAHAVNQNTAAVTVTPTFEDGSDLHNIPGFQDPELRGDDGDDDGRLRLNAPPDIYSSQVLSTVVNDEEGEESGYRREEEEYGIETTASMGMGNGSDIPSSHGIDIILNTGSPLIVRDFDASLPEDAESAASPCQSRESQVSEADNHRMTPEGAQEGIIQEYHGASVPSIISHQHHDLQMSAVDEDDVVYDKPVIKQGRSPSLAGIRDDDIKVPGIVDLSALFDDPGYTKGLNLAGNDGDSKNSESQLPAHVQRKLSTHKRTSNLESSSAPKMHSLSVQMGRVPGMKSSIDSLALLDYDDSELNELDPMIASCLRSPNLSDSDDEIAISEV